MCCKLNSRSSFAREYFKPSAFLSSSFFSFNFSCSASRFLSSTEFLRVVSCFFSSWVACLYCLVALITLASSEDIKLSLTTISNTSLPSAPVRNGIININKSTIGPSAASSAAADVDDTRTSSNKEGAAVAKAAAVAAVPIPAAAALKEIPDKALPIAAYPAVAVAAVTPTPPAKAIMYGATTITNGTPKIISGFAIPSVAATLIILPFLYTSNCLFKKSIVFNLSLKLSHCFCNSPVIKFFSIFNLMILIYKSFSMKFFDINSIFFSLNFSFILSSSLFDSLSSI